MKDQAAMAYTHLRTRILSGELPAGSQVNQVHLANELGVSRGPIRDALRKLETEGLVDWVTNQRSRVAEASIEDLEQIYAARVVLEPLALLLTAPHLAEEDFLELEAVLAEMREATHNHDEERWDGLHLVYHRRLLSAAGDRLVQLTDQLREHAERYRRIYAGQARAYAQANTQHADILQACKSGNMNAASHQLAQHLAATALGVIAILDPLHNPATLRLALESSLK